MDELSELRTKLDQLKSQMSGDSVQGVQSAQKVSEVWVKLNDVVSHLSPEQIAYINSNKELISKKAELNGVFNEWLFEKYKNEFTQIPQFEAIAREYVGFVEKASHEYIESAKTVMTENEQLRSELEELKKKLAETQISRRDPIDEVLL
jgi:cell division septum initiation protein DivIVA